MRNQPYWQIGILFPDGKKISKYNCTLNDVFKTYFLNLDKYLNSNLTPEELLNKYKENFSKKEIKIQINYIDSWSHRWSGKVAWPKEDKFLEYLKSKLND